MDNQIDKRISKIIFDTEPKTFSNITNIGYFDLLSFHVLLEIMSYLDDEAMRATELSCSFFGKIVLEYLKNQRNNLLGDIQAQRFKLKKVSDDPLIDLQDRSNLSRAQLLAKFIFQESSGPQIANRRYDSSDSDSWWSSNEEYSVEKQPQSSSIDDKFTTEKKAKLTHDLFGSDSEDEYIFSQTKKLKPKDSLFDSDSEEEDELFSNPKKPKQTQSLFSSDDDDLFSNPKKPKPKHSLFDSDSEEEDIFSNPKKPKQTQSLFSSDDDDLFSNPKIKNTLPPNYKKHSTRLFESDNESDSEYDSDFESDFLLPKIQREYFSNQCCDQEDLFGECECDQMLNMN